MCPSFTSTCIPPQRHVQSAGACLDAGRSRTGVCDPGSSRRQSNPQRRKAGEQNVSHSVCNIPAKAKQILNRTPAVRARQGTKRRMAQPAGGKSRMVALDDTVGAFVPGPRLERRPLGSGRLSGLGFAVKDLFDVAGSITTYGNPDWASTHAAASATAPVVTALLQAGARLVGKTKTVELAYGLTGENVWQGTPVNPRAPDRFPGGSSCGSAAAVAAGLVDFALGSDTGGSVRIPASYCGLFGIRPSHGAVSLAGACPLAPSFDTCGWFTRSAALLAGRGRGAAARRPPGGGRPTAAGRGGLGQRTAGSGRGPAPGAGAARAVARQGNRHTAGPRGDRQHLRSLPHGAGGGGLGMSRRLGRGGEAALRPRHRRALRRRQGHRAAVAAPGRAFGACCRRASGRCWPAAPCWSIRPAPAPRRCSTASMAEQDAVRQATMGVTAIAGFCGLPEVTLPAGSVNGVPVGLSLVAGPGLRPRTAGVCLRRGGRAWTAGLSAEVTARWRSERRPRRIFPTSSRSMPTTC